MGYLDRFKGKPLITNPKNTYNYTKVIKNKTNDVKSDRELVKEKKAELSPEDFTKWYHKHTYQKRKEKVRQQYQAKKTLEEALAIETYHEIFDDEPSIPTYKDLEKEYIEEARKYYTSKANRWVFYWWCSRLVSVKFNSVLLWMNPIRICENLKMNKLFLTELKEQQRIANILKPHLDEICLEEIILRKKQNISSRPNYKAIGRLEEIINENHLPCNFACEIASALIRDRYIDWLPYLWHNNYLLGDFIATGKGQVLLPALDNNLPYLTRETLNDIHNQTIAWLNEEKNKVPLYLMRDLYLVRIPASKFQNENKEDDSNNSYYYYVVPFNWLLNN